MGVQYRLCVAAWLSHAGKYQLTSRLESVATLWIDGHWPIIGVSLILLVYDCRHSSKGLPDLIFADDTVMQPIGNVLAGDTQRGTVFHQSDIVNVRHFGATHAVFHPAHDIAKDAPQS